MSVEQEAVVRAFLAELEGQQQGSAQAERALFRIIGRGSGTRRSSISRAGHRAFSPKPASPPASDSKQQGPYPVDMCAPAQEGWQRP